MTRAGRLVILACAATVGCGILPTRPSVSQIVQSLTPPQSLSGLLLESVLIEQPVGDPFLNHDLWVRATAVGEPETRALLAENGLRVGALSGTIPPRLQTLLDSDGDTVNPQLQTFQQRKDTVLPTNEPPDPCRFSVLTDFAATPRDIELRQARSGLSVRPTPTGDGRVKLGCEPLLQHGTRREWYRPNEDGTRFVKCEEVPTVRFPELAFEVTLRPDDYLLVGWDVSRRDSLGAVLFATEAYGRPRQRLLLVRARHTSPTPAAADPHPVGGALVSPSPASQAATPGRPRGERLAADRP